MKKLCIAAIALLFLLPVTVQAAESVPGASAPAVASGNAGQEAALRLLDQVLATEDPQAQLELVFKAAKADPENPEILLNCAQLILYLDPYGVYGAECEAMLRDALAFATGDLRLGALHMLMEQLIYAERFDEAIGLVEKEIAQNPEDEQLEITLATALFYSGENEKAVELLEALLEDSPKNLDALRLRAAMLSSEARWEEALQAYRQIAREFPEYLDGLFGQFQTYLASGQFDRAIRAVDELLRSGGNYSLWLDRARIRLWNQYRPEEALQEADALLRSDPEWIDAAVVKVGSLLMLERYDDALAALDILEAYDKDYAGLLRGVVEMNRGDWEKAEEILTALHEALPQFSSALLNLSTVRLDGFGDTDGAMAAMEKAFAILGGRGDTDMFTRLGHVYRRQGNYLEAAKAYAEADRRTFEDPSPLFYLTMVSADAGRAQDMEKALAQMEKRYPGFYETMLARALVEEMLGHPQEALSAFEALKEKFPTPAASLIDLEGELVASAKGTGGAEMIEAWMKDETDIGASHWAAYAYALMKQGDLKAAEEALGKAEALIPDASLKPGEARLGRIAVETTRAELLLQQGDVEGCIAAFAKAAEAGWPPSTLSLYEEYDEVYASDAYQALLGGRDVKAGTWDLTEPPAIPGQP